MDDMRWLTWLGLAVTAAGLFHLWVKTEQVRAKQKEYIEKIQEVQALIGECVIAKQTCKDYERLLQKELQCSQKNSSNNESRGSEPAKPLPSSG